MEETHTHAHTKGALNTFNTQSLTLTGQYRAQHTFGKSGGKEY